MAPFSYRSSLIPLKTSSTYHVTSYEFFQRKFGPTANVRRWRKLLWRTKRFSPNSFRRGWLKDSSWSSRSTETNPFLKRRRVEQFCQGKLNSQVILLLNCRFCHHLTLVCSRLMWSWLMLSDDYCKQVV